MKKLIINSVVFVIAFICFNLYLKGTSKFYDQQEEYQESIDRSLNSKSEIILLGDSHLASLKKVHLDEKIGNLAYGADGIKEMYAKALIILNENPKVEYVFLSTEPQMFNAGTSPNGTFLNPYILNLKEARSLFNKNKLDVICDYVPLFNNDYLNFFRSRVYNYFKGSAKLQNEKAWDELSIDEKGALASKLGKADHSSIMKQPKDTIYFRMMMDLFNKNGVKVISIQFPVTLNYIEQCNKEDLQKVNQFLDDFQFYKSLDFTYSVHSLSYFEDSDHMKKIGVEKIVKKIENQTGLTISK